MQNGVVAKALENFKFKEDKHAKHGIVYDAHKSYG